MQPLRPEGFPSGKSKGLIYCGKMPYTCLHMPKGLTKSASGSSVSGILLSIIYILINTLFVWKYGREYLPGFKAAPLIYIVFCIVLIKVISGRFFSRLNSVRYDPVYFGAVFFLALVLSAVMFHFDPESIRVGRYPALHDWITRILHGEFPYISSTRPSGFPFLFILTLPFYLIGDLGLFQIFGFLLFALIVFIKNRHGELNRTQSLLLLIFAPAFLYEIVVRSELFTNITIITAYLLFCERHMSRINTSAMIILGLLGGFLLSTRGIVLLIYLIFLKSLPTKSKTGRTVFILFLSTGFIITLTPFAVWDWGHFITFGPFAVQSSYAPWWIISIFIILAASIGFRTQSWNGAALAASVILFAAVLTAFGISVLRFDLPASVLHSKFDISYFSFALPFLLISMATPKRRQE
jgi:hypothetical protein